MIALLLVLLAPPELRLERGPVAALAQLDAAELRLSDALTLTLTVTGPEPLRVEPPDPPIGGTWSYRPLGQPEVSSGIWRQRYRLSPQQPGDLPLIVGAFSCRAGNAVAPVRFADWPSLNVRVTTEVLTPDLDDLRPLAGLEPAPPAPPRVWWPWLLLPALLLVGIVVRRARRRPPPLSPADYAARTLRRPNLSAADIDRALRDYLATRFQTPTAPRTAAELRADLAPHLAEAERDALTELLAQLDLARFTPPTDADLSHLTQNARDWIERNAAAGRAETNAPPHQ